jgi:CubicO group peptidase (beta-lactamase class C family)
MKIDRRRPVRIGLAAFLAWAPLCARAQEPPHPSASSRILGLWGVTRSFGPEIRGELTIVRDGSAWVASIGGIRTEAQSHADAIDFELPGHLGRFRGRREPSGAGIRGHWVQPPGLATGVAWATPVELRPVGRDAWRGIVTVLDETINLYMDARVDPDGVLRAVFRNPDGYFGNPRMVLSVHGDRLTFANDKGATLLEGDYDAGHDRILLPIPDGAPVAQLHTTLELTRRSRDDAPGYYPRTPPEPRYDYRPPVADGDGWQTASLSEVGLDPARITALVQKISDTDPRPKTAPLIHGLLIARHGKLVLEEYFYGFDEERPHDLRSAGKTFASVLAGIAIDHGARFGPGTPVYALFRGYSSFAHPDPRKQRMTVEHLMTMTSGFDCDENNNDDAPGNEDKMQSQTGQPDWYKFMLDQPLAAAPGDAFAYCSGAVNLVGGIVRNATGTWLPEIFDRYLARPLSLRAYHINLMPTGEAYMGGGLHIRPRDELKLGQVYLDGGVWKGRRIVSRSWVAASTARHPMNAHGTDGYDWHTNDIRLGNRVFREYDASGNGGQLLMIVPELDLVVLITAGNFNNYGVWRRFRDELLPQDILASAVR